jgi:hypothetical protein
MYRTMQQLQVASCDGARDVREETASPIDRSSATHATDTLARVGETFNNSDSKLFNSLEGQPSQVIIRTNALINCL